jgi:hypothetical protein
MGHFSNGSLLIEAVLAQQLNKYFRCQLNCQCKLLKTVKNSGEYWRVKFGFAGVFNNLLMF